VKLFLSGLKTAGLGRKILWGKDLAARYSVFNELFLTSSAGAMMNELFLRRKVRCHKVGCENLRDIKGRRDWRSWSPTLVAKNATRMGHPADHVWTIEEMISLLESRELKAA
jgi:hypothetical protein